MKQWIAPVFAWGSILGIGFGLAVDHVHQSNWMWVVFLLGIVLSLFLVRKNTFLTIVLIGGLGICLGIWKADLWSQQRAQLVSQTWTGQAVVSELHHHTFGWEIVLQWNRPGPFSKTTAQVRTPIAVGSVVDVWCDLQPGQSTSFFDSEHWAESQGIAGECEKIDLKPHPPTNTWSFFTLQTWAARSRHFIQIQIDATFQPPVSWLASGLLIGDRGDWSQNFNLLFQLVGLSHIVALSGWNVTMLCGVLVWVLMRAGLTARKATGWGMLGVTVFVIMTGASASLVRAAVMSGLCAAGRFSHRPQSAQRILLLTCAVMIFLNPPILLWDISFQLSVLATLALVVDGWAYLEGWKAPLWETAQTVRTSLAVTLVTLPYIIWKFHRFSLVAIPLNVLILPTLPIATASAALGVTLSVLGIHQPTLTWFTSLPLALIIRLAQFASQLPWSNVSVGS